MPNWTYNIIQIKGSKKELEEFLNKHCEPRKYQNHLDEEVDYMYFDFNTFIPEPQSIEECIEKYGEDYVIKEGEDRHLQFTDDRKWFDWYSWHLDYWDTKWPACDSEVEMIDGENEDECTVEIRFSTAWSPCMSVINKMIEMYKGLDIRYWYSEEQGLPINGYIESIHGKVDRSEEDASTVEKAREICIFVQGWDPLAEDDDEAEAEDEDETDVTNAEA